MSRLFGYFGNQAVNLSCELIENKAGEEKFDKPSARPDGWGIGFFRNNASFLFRKSAQPSRKQRIANIAEVISSNIFISHLRYATIGERKEANTQPFRWGNWLFAHHGTIHHFRKIRPRILRKLPVAYKKQIKGNTDSEHLFYFFLTMLRGEGAIKKGDIQIASAVKGLKNLGMILQEFCVDAEAIEYPTLNLLISNGEYLLAARNGNPLYYLSRSSLDTPETSFLSKETGFQYEILNFEDENDYFVISSEKLSDNPNWQELPDNHILVIDAALSMKITPWLE